jgi:hypothetical protein
MHASGQLQRSAINVQVLRDVRDLPRLNEEISVVDESNGAECAGVVLRSHPTTVEHAAVEEKLRGGVRS